MKKRMINIGEDNAQPIPEMKSYEEIAEFWDTHSIADYWDKTEPAEFEISPDVRRRFICLYKE